MDKNWNKYINAYTNASSEVKRLIDSEVIPEFAQTIDSIYGPSSVEMHLLISLLAETYLNIHDTNEFIDFLQKNYDLTDTEGETLSGHIKTFMHNPQRGLNILKSPNPLKNQAKITEVPPVVEPKAENIPKNPNDLTALHTMREDMSKVHGYGAFRDKTESSQAATKTQNNLAETPNYSESDRD